MPALAHMGDLSGSPPSYSDLLPKYSARASQSESVLLASQHGSNEIDIEASTIDRCMTLPSTYRTSCKRLELNLGRRLFNSCDPVYGFGAPIEGFVEIKKHIHVSRVEVSVEGRAYAVYVDHGLTTLQKSYILLQLKNTVYCRTSSSDPIPEDSTRYHFSFSIPTDPDLPPTCTSLLPRIEARVWYYVRVDMFRSGLRSHISIQLPILYLPRSRPPPPVQGTSRYISLSSALDTKLVGIDNSKWKTINVTIKPCDISAQLSLPTPVIYPSGHAIPFILSLIWLPSNQSMSSSELEARHREFMSYSIKIQLVKTVTLQVIPRRSKREYLLQTAKIWRDERCEAFSQTTQGEGIRRYLRGTVSAGKPGGEVNWICKDMIDVKYCIRMTIEPSPCDLSMVPTLTHDEPISLTTHDWEPPQVNRDLLPALSLRRAWR